MEHKTEFTYTLDDLDRIEFSGTPLAVLGHPIRHSISPAMQNAGIADLRKRKDRFKDWAYYRFDVPPEALPEALERFHKHNFLGINLTIPHKVEVLPELCGISKDAQRMGASNTLLWGELGYDGFNTDGYGLQTALKEDLGISLKGSDVILLGSGGAARAAAVQCLQADCARLWIGNRSLGRLEALTESLAPLGRGASTFTFPLDQPPNDLPEQGVLINATSLGLKANDPLPLDPAKLPGGWAVFDMIYNPPLSPLLAKAKASGHRTANGLAMLVHQGARSLEIWSKEDVSAHAMMTAACHALNLPPRYVRNL